jgi:hypothetical protein
MFNKLEVRNPAGTLLTLVLDDVTDGYVLKDIQGLDPVKATIISSTFANLDGVQYQTARREARNIIVKLGLEPDYATGSVRALRTNLYTWFMTKAPVNLTLYDDDGLTVNIDGHVEYCNTPPFAKEPEASISIICENPDFVELTAVSGSGSTVSTTTEFSFNYTGSVEAGIQFTLALNRSLSGFTIYHRPPDNITRTFDFVASMLNLDSVNVDMNRGSKGVTLTRSSVQSSMLYGRQRGSAWFLLQPGVNYFRFYASGAAIPFTYSYTRRHGGL